MIGISFWLCLTSWTFYHLQSNDRCLPARNHAKVNEFDALWFGGARTCRSGKGHQPFHSACLSTLQDAARRQKRIKWLWRWSHDWHQQSNCPNNMLECEAWKNEKKTVWLSQSPLEGLDQLSRLKAKYSPAKGHDALFPASGHQDGYLVTFAQSTGDSHNTNLSFGFFRYRSLRFLPNVFGVTPNCCHGTCGAIPLHKRSEQPMATSPTAKHGWELIMLLRGQWNEISNYGKGSNWRWVMMPAQRAFWTLKKGRGMTWECQSWGTYL